MNFLQQLRWRGLLHQTAGDQLESHLDAGARVAYCGFDPTADSLTVGNLLSIKMLMHWQRCGHRPIVLLGGGTGLIGDPSGKDSERSLQTYEVVQHNIHQQSKIFHQLLDFDRTTRNRALLVNNHDWLQELSFIQMLRDTGKYFSVNQMMQRDAVKDRLHNRDQGISYTEFSYVLLQAYDFLHLYRQHQCSLQLAGSDQYGNIVSGMDLIRRCCGPDARAFGVTNKLVTKSDGTKIGKSAGNTVWLSADRTSAYTFYQFWLNTDDADIIKFLKWFTFLEREHIDALDSAHQTAPHQREAHRQLAAHLTRLVHGESALGDAVRASAVLFGGGDVSAVDAATLDELFADAPGFEFDRATLGGEGSDIVPILVQTGLAASNSRARELIKDGAIAVNGVKIAQAIRLNAERLLHGHTVLLKRGKKNWVITRWK